MSPNGTPEKLSEGQLTQAEQTFAKGRGPAENDPLRSILWLGHMAVKAIDPIGTKLHKSEPRHCFLCRQVQGFAAFCVIAPLGRKMLRLRYGGCPATGQCGGSYDRLAWVWSIAPAAPHPGGDRPGKRAHLGLSLATK